jgi:hypothetical protein
MTRLWIALGAACWIVGCASTGNAPVRSNGAPVAATPAGCVAQTDPIPGCIGPGNSYSQNDITNTGQITVPRAPGSLDPTITVHH